jgi:hypothetical protein
MERPAPPSGAASPLSIDAVFHAVSGCSELDGTLWVISGGIAYSVRLRRRACHREPSRCKRRCGPLQNLRIATSKGAAHVFRTLKRHARVPVRLPGTNPRPYALELPEAGFDCPSS